ncbi:MAG: class I SAM-dependent methyltransferase [Alphaproteobacteria bacterium]|nr:class I SAM-dependent methyltransferase [Alphaproteobacteria bacterium]
MLAMELDHDEAARERYVVSLKWHINLDLGPQLRSAYEGQAKPRFQRQHGRSPKDRHEVRELMLTEPSYQAWGSLSYLAQELMWTAIETEIARMQPALNTGSKVVRPRGSLTVDPAFRAPRYVTAVDIHLQPGGYALDLGEGDVTAGAFYEGATRMYALGQGIRIRGNRALPEVLAELKRQYPRLAPKRILDIGCNIGGSSMACKDVFPEAEVYGIDIGAGLIRYAHARAESVDKAIHFSVQNGERTNFADGFFDLVASGTLLHETSYKAIYNIFQEAHRLLAPGGVMAHLEIPVRHADMDIFTQFGHDWSTHFNAEPFWGTLHDMDVLDPMVKGGFARNKCWQRYISLPNGSRWWVCGAQKS